MVIQIALALVMTSTVAPCIEPLSRCAASLADSALVWRGRAEVERAKLRGCQAKLDVRSSTGAQARNVLCPEPIPPSMDFGALIGVGGGSMLLGFVLGAILGR